MVSTRVVDFVKRASRGLLYICHDAWLVSLVLVLWNVSAAFAASTAQVYEIGTDCDNEDLMWVDHNPYFDAAMVLFNIEDTEGHEEYYLLPYFVVAFLLSFFIRHNPTNHAFGRIDVDTIHHDVLTRALQWVVDQLEEMDADLSSVSALTDSVVAIREDSTVEFDAALELSEPYDIATAPAELYGFADPIEGDALVDDAGFLSVYGLLMITIGPFATEAQRDPGTEFRRQLTLLSTSMRSALQLPAGAVPLPLACPRDGCVRTSLTRHA